MFGGGGGGSRSYSSGGGGGGGGGSASGVVHWVLLAIGLFLASMAAVAAVIGGATGASAKTEKKTVEHFKGGAIAASVLCVIAILVLVAALLTFIYKV
jgi:hypothetical protein